jgi:RNA polymerase sigma factor (sigma-70 family)
VLRTPCKSGWPNISAPSRKGSRSRIAAPFVVRAAFCRAIDELRREARQSDSDQVEAILESSRFAAPATDEIAIEHLAAEELHKAIETLSAEKRQALSLHYFEQLSAERSAEILYCSERTFRRLLAKALSDLSRRLGVPAPDPGSNLAIEIGLASWVSLRGADVALAGGLPQAFLGILERGRDSAAWALDRLRGQATRFSAGGDGEKLSAIASGPIGKVAGGCAGAAAVCLLGGTIGGIGGPGDLFGHHSSLRPNIARHTSIRAARVARPRTLPRGDSRPAASPPQPTAAPQAPSAAQRRRIARRAEQRQLEEQFSATTRVESESSAGGASAASAPATETVTVAPSGSSSTSGQASEEAQAEQQFGAFK